MSQNLWLKKQRKSVINQSLLLKIFQLDCLRNWLDILNGLFYGSWRCRWNSTNTSVGMRAWRPKWPLPYSRGSRWKKSVAWPRNQLMYSRVGKSCSCREGRLPFRLASRPRRRPWIEDTSLKAKVGTLVMDNELLSERITRLEDGVSFHWRKSKC